MFAALAVAFVLFTESAVARADEPQETPASVQPADTPEAPSDPSDPSDKDAPASRGEPASQPSAAPTDETPVTKNAPEAETTTSDPPAASQSDSDRTATPVANDEDETDQLQMELYVDSVRNLIDAAKKSRTAVLYQALSGLIPTPVQESDDDIDFAAITALFERMEGWPDTFVSLQIFTSDGAGRARWSVRVAWSLDDLRARLEDLFNNSAAESVIGEVTLRAAGDERYEVVLANTVVAVLWAFEDSAVIAACDDVKPKLTSYEAWEKDHPRVVHPLCACRLNITDAGDGGAGAWLAGTTGVRDVRFTLDLDAEGRWDENWKVAWNPFVGVALKSVIKKVNDSFDCPDSAYAAAAFSTLGAQAMADTIAQLDAGTLSPFVSDEYCVTAIPGTGFLPIPDIIFQTETRRLDEAVEAMKTFVKNDTAKRRKDGKRPRWYAETMAGRDVFWRDPGADGGTGMVPVTFRSVVFFEKSGTSGQRGRAVIAETSIWPDDLLERWDAFASNRKSRITVPSSDRAHWQAVINWYNVYELAQPWLSLAAGFVEGADLPPSPKELGDALPSSTVDVRIEFAGLKVRHVGPVPLSTAYIPVAAGIALGKSLDSASESAREEIASRHLRVLHHHATLFNKDFGRWPARVAELDGYVDFASHGYLLRLRPKDAGFLAMLETSLSGVKPDANKPDEDADEDEADWTIDDSLYVVHWSKNKNDWQLGIAEGRFKHVKTIYIDAEGEIHRVAIDAEPSGTDAPPAAGVDARAAADPAEPATEAASTATEAPHEADGESDEQAAAVPVAD